MEGKHFMVVLFGNALAMSIGPNVQATTWYVRGESAGGNGTSWGMAFKNPRSALDRAVAGDQIWVAVGVYEPSRRSDPSDPRTASFHIAKKISIYGGFNGTETALAQRAPDVNATILSGDIGIAGDDTDNSYHVVLGQGSGGDFVLDGLVIAFGNADKSSPHNLGGALLNISGSPMLTNCVFFKNTSEYGGAVYTAYGAPTFVNCKFRGNLSVHGGAICNELGNPTLDRCTFIVNSSIYGGAFYNFGGSPVLKNCIFSGNSSTDFGGGLIDSGGNGTLVMLNCTAVDNRTDIHGGGLANLGTGSLVVTNCIFWGNVDDANATSGGPFVDSLAQIDVGPGTATVTYSCVQGGWRGAGEGNIRIDPLLVNRNGADGIVGTLDDDLHLREDSPCFDAGDPNLEYAGQMDFEADPRRVYARADIGADEAVIRVRADFDNDGDVDPLDFLVFSGCYDKKNPYAPECKNPSADLDQDGDVDGADFLSFGTCFNGARVPPSCR